MRGAPLLLAPVLLLPACSLYADAKEVVAEARKVADEIKVVRAQADVNKDGKIDGPEWGPWVAGIAGVLSAALARYLSSRETAAAKVEVKQDVAKVEMASVKSSDELYDRTHQPIVAAINGKLAEGVVITDK